MNTTITSKEKNSKFLLLNSNNLPKTKDYSLEECISKMMLKNPSTFTLLFVGKETNFDINDLYRMLLYKMINENIKIVRGSSNEIVLSNGSEFVWSTVPLKTTKGIGFSINIREIFIFESGIENEERKNIFEEIIKPISKDLTKRVIVILERSNDARNDSDDNNNNNDDKTLTSNGGATNKPYDSNKKKLSKL
jgi:hypothetical protein